MVANEVNKLGQIFPIHRRRNYKDIGYTPHFFPNLFQNHPVYPYLIIFKCILK
jgi:3-hydroxymyristoyl/3-hydroxydecanoyl-(acyl carrier protein) dehydratase